MKKILIIATAILVFILLLIFALSSIRKNAKTGVESPSMTPTTAPFNSPLQHPQLIESARNVAPYDAETFTFDYDPQLNKMVVTEKGETAISDFNVWIAEVGLPELVGNSDVVVFRQEDTQNKTPQASDSTGPLSTGASEYEKTVKPLIDFLNVFVNFGQGTDGSPNPTPIPLPTSGSQSRSQPSSSNNQDFKYTYYAQCNGYGNIPLPSGCNLCEAGCGPTTVAMIASSYIDKKYNPKEIVDMYEKRGYYLSCAGSGYADAKSALESLGLKTTSYMSYNYAKADEVASDFKKYLDAGWTIFTLASYCDKGCGHYFWVTGIKNGDILAYDPYYGKSSPPPINENARYPFPKYRLAFGVKK